MKEVKQQLFKACQYFVLEKEKTIKDIISSNQNALHSETKGSAGDKHETGRAMLQLEMEKSGQQLAVIDQMKMTLERISINDNSEIVKLGSLVTTNKHHYFLAISVGEIQIDNEKYYAVSIASPIGKQLLGTKVGDEFTFNGRIIVKSIF